MTHDDLRDALAFHALGSPADARVAAHVAACATCAGELGRLRATAASLVFAAPALAPSPGHLARVLAAVDIAETRRRVVRSAARPSRRPVRSRPLARALRVAVACALVLLAVSQVVLVRRLAGARREIASMRAIGAFLGSPDVSIVPLSGRNAQAKLAFDRTTGRFVFLSDDLAPPPMGSRYQLWVVGDGVEPANVRVAAAAHGTLATAPRADAPFLFGVSIEPTSGTTEPTGPMVLLSPVLRNPR